MTNTLDADLHGSNIHLLLGVELVKAGLSSQHG